MSSTLLSPALVFLGKMTLVSAFLYGYYWFFLRNASFHPYNRWYLLGSVGLSLFLPLLHIPLPAGWMSGEHYTLLLSPDQAASGGIAADPAPLSGHPPGLFYGLFRGWKTSGYSGHRSRIALFPFSTACSGTPNCCWTRIGDRPSSGMSSTISGRDIRWISSRWRSYAVFSGAILCSTCSFVS